MAKDDLLKRFERTRSTIHKVLEEVRRQRDWDLRQRLARNQSDILLQAVVEFQGKTEEGQLIEAVAAPWFEIVRLLKADPTAIYKIKPRKWEELIAGWYEQSGFDEVTLTPSSGDRGRDVIAIKHGVLTVRVIDQVKAYKPGHLVLANDVRALAGVLSTDFRATKGIVTTTSDFAPMISTDPSIAPLIPYRIELVNGTELIQRLISAVERKF